MVDIGDTRRRRQGRPSRGEAAPPTDTECFDGSSAQKTASLVLGWPSGILAGDRRAGRAVSSRSPAASGRLLLQLTGAAIALGAVSILVGSV